MRTVLAHACIFVLSCTQDSDGLGGNECLQGTFSVATGVLASGFDYPDGTVVHATFGGNSPQYASDTIDDGAFTFSFYQPSETCNLGASIEEPAAFYIDANGDDTCTLGDDYVFVWLAYGGQGGYSSEMSGGQVGRLVLPSSPRCPTSAPMGAGPVVDAVRRLCPEVDDCIPFCVPPEPGQVNRANTLACIAVNPQVADAGSQ